MLPALCVIKNLTDHNGGQDTMVDSGLLSITIEYLKEKTHCLNFLHIYDLTNESINSREYAIQSKNALRGSEGRKLVDSETFTQARGAQCQE